MTVTSKTKPAKRRFVKMSPKQLEFHNATEDICSLCTGIGFGKTRAGITKIFLTAKDGQSCMTLSPSYVMLRRSTIVLAKQVAKELDILKKLTITPYPILTFKTQDGGVAELLGASTDNPDSIRGANLDMVHLDESSYMPEVAFQIAAGRLRGTEGQVGQKLLTFTPRGRSNWTFGLHYKEAKVIPAGPEEAKALGLIQVSGKWYEPKPGTKLIRASSRDNPFISEDFYASLKGLYSSQFAAQELEGEWVEIAGLIFKREWFFDHMVDAAPRIARRVRYWDLAATEFDGCYTCGTLIAMTDRPQTYVENVVRGQWSTFTRNSMIRETAKLDARRYGNEVHQVVEQEPGSGGKEQVQQMIRMLTGHPVYRDLPSQGQSTRTQDGQKLPGSAKIYRAQPFAAQCEAGNVYVVRGDWTDEWLAELTSFPEMAICDQVDSTSAAYNYLAKSHVPNPGEIGLVSAPSNVPSKYGMPSANRRYELPSFIGRN